MTAGKRIELSLGQNPGEFTLCLDGVAITVQMREVEKAWQSGEAAPKAPVPPPPPQERAPTEAAENLQEIEYLSGELNRYQQWIKEIYEGLGKLAKDINVSIQDLSLAELIQTSMGSPGEHLDQARNQVTDVLMMTEQATLNIMDLVEEIREDCQAVQKKLLSLTAGETEGEAPAETDLGSGGRGEEEALWRRVLAQAEELGQFLGRTALEAPSSEGNIPLFSLSEVLQILLEYCANEKVKQHLKAVQNRQEAVFARPEVEGALSLLAAGAPKEEGFYQLPVTGVLEVLISHCQDERVKELLVKMASSADKLYPLPELPLEARDETGGAEGDQGPLEATGGPGPLWEEFRQNLHALWTLRRETPAGCPGPGLLDVRAVLDTVDHITKNLSRIIEALSFQDLSGQRLLKILKIIRQLQVQVLTLLVAAGERLQSKLDARILGSTESSQAREELDRLLTSIAPSSDEKTEKFPADQPLDQNAINELLTSMGF